MGWEATKWPAERSGVKKKEMVLALVSTTIDASACARIRMSCIPTIDALACTRFWMCW